MRLADDKMCFVCGQRNDHGLRLQFRIDEDGKMRTEFTPQKVHQGFVDIAHGGIIAMILDEIMVNLLWRLGKHAVTAEMNIKFKKPTTVGETLYFTGEIARQTRRIIYTRADTKKADGSTVASATAKCIKV